MPVEDVLSLGSHLIPKDAPFDLIEGPLDGEEGGSVAVGAELVHEEVVWGLDPAAGPRPCQSTVQNLGIPVVFEVLGVNRRGAGSGPVGEGAGS